MPSDERAHLLEGHLVNDSKKVYIMMPNEEEVGNFVESARSTTNERTSLLATFADRVMANRDGLLAVEQVSDDEDDPQRPPTKRTLSNFNAFLNLVKGNLGTGIIGLPFAFKYSGVITGFLLMLFICVAALNCMHMLAKASHRLCKMHNLDKLSYGGVAQHTAKLLLSDEKQYRARWARFVVQTFLVVTQIGFCAVYFVFIPANLQQVLSACGWTVDLRLLIVVILPFLVVGVQIRDLNTMGLFSAIGNVLQTVSLVTMFIYLSMHIKTAGIRLFPAATLDVAMFFGMAMFSVEGIGVVLPLENRMLKPRSFFTVVNSGMGFVSVLYLVMGTLGYMTFGDLTKGSITLNLPEEALNENIPYILVKLFYSLAIMSSFLVQFYVVIDIMQVKLLHHYIPARQHTLFHLGFRTLIVVISASMAAAIPELGLFISLVGAVGSSALAMIFPSIIYLVVFWKEVGMWTVIKNIILANIGLLGMCFGTFVTLREMSRKL